MYSPRLYLWAAVGLLALAADSARADTISTFSAWNGTSEIISWGEPASTSTETYGQTFVASSAKGTFLNSVEFWIKNNSDSQFTPGPISFQAYVYEWTGSAITGSALFTSGVQTLPVNTNLFQNVTVNTGSTALVDGKSYIAMFSTLGQAGSDGGAGWGVVDNSTYPAGGFVYSNANAFNDLSATANWNEIFTPNNDLVFTLSFSNTSGGPDPPPQPSPSGLPEPTSLALFLVSGAAGLGAWMRRRRSAV